MDRTTLTITPDIVESAIINAEAQLKLAEASLKEETERLIEEMDAWLELPAWRHRWTPPPEPWAADYRHSMVYSIQTTIAALKAAKKLGAACTGVTYWHVAPVNSEDTKP